MMAFTQVMVIWNPLRTTLIELSNKICHQHIRYDDNSYREVEFDRKIQEELSSMHNTRGLSMLIAKDFIIFIYSLVDFISSYLTAVTLLCNINN